MKARGRLIILSGPSCVGKSPLFKALRQFQPELMARVRPLVLYNSRSPRPGESDGKDYHFRSRAEIERLRGNDRFVVIDVRGDLQALDVEELDRNLAKSDMLFEGNPFIGETLLVHEQLREVARLSVFIAPLSLDEVKFLKSQPGVAFDALIVDVMRRKLLRRTRKQKGELSLKDLEEIERRAGSAPRELAMAPLFQYVVPNHDGEDSENWNAFYHPIGDARRTFLAVAGLLGGKKLPHVEKWPKNLFPRKE
ncbi:guanylate kinase [Terrimicrobium sacchariphilum]|uniref:guanylate kinase n=1 Tax=Terrimicrobium sacchariphilum TaxID=690879 RepID=UPI000946602B|nr:hypothetical protein [Terrimicrobium sacchariphilum]